MGEWSCGHFPTGERLTPTDLTECPSISSALTHFWVICCIATFISLVFWSFFPLTNPYFKPSCLVWVESGQVQQLLGLMIATMTMGGDYRPSAGFCETSTHCRVISCGFFLWNQSTLELVSPICIFGT